jgi:hypothetical protein
MGTSNSHKQAMKEWGKQFSLKYQMEYHSNPNLCKQCLSPISYEKRNTNKFCSSSCSATYSNSRRRLRPVRNCLCCGKELTGRKVMKYCNTKCQKTHHREKTKKEWYDKGILPGWRYIRTILFEDRGKQCEVCGITEWNGIPISFEVDHIDGVHSNNTPNNLRIICPNCHSQTDTYKAKNVGNGRHYRRTRYEQGKSY